MPEFPTTRLSLVLAAADQQRAKSGEALETLCRLYWQPLYAFVRRRGYAHEEAEDLTQGFIARMLEKGALREFERERGRFRSFLLASLKNFLNNQRDSAQAQKRGGAVAAVPISQAEVRDDATPDRIFERQWALAVLSRALEQLREEFEREGKADRFGLLSACLTADDRTPYRELAQRMEMSEGAVRVAAHRLKRRFHELLREEISLTVTDTGEIGEEVRYLLEALRV
jgi:RNA polymerase sigma factor (sigma-70 family)